MIFVWGFIVTVIIVVFLLNVCIYRYLVRKSIKHYLAPYFENRQEIIANTKFTGLLNQGYFAESRFKISPVFKKGQMYNSTYMYLYVTSSKKEESIYTVRIETFFLKILKVHLKYRDGTIELIPHSTMKKQ